MRAAGWKGCQPTRTAARSRCAAERATRGRRALEDPFIGWTATLAITLVGLFLRLWKIGTPHAFEFDETYYAKDAWSLWHFGYARDYLDNDGGDRQQAHPGRADFRSVEARPLDGGPPRGRQVADRAGREDLRLHPARLARRTGHRRDAADPGDDPLRTTPHRLDAARLRRGLLVCFDGLELVLSRLALLDIFVAFFLLCAVHCLVLDRDWYRARMASLVPGQIQTGWGPVRALLFRPWLLVSGICWGLACGSKWEAVYPLAAFGVLVVAWCAGARRSFGVTWSGPKALVADGLPAFAHLVLVALVVYVATWTGWLMHSSQYAEYLGDSQYTHYVSGGSDCGKNITFDNSQQWPTHDQTVEHGLPGRCRAWTRSGTTTATSTSSTPTSSTDAPTRTPPSRVAGCCSTVRSGSTRRRASSRAWAAATPRRAATACARCCSSAPRRCGGAASGAPVRRL